MDFQTLIKTRRSVRSYDKSKQVSKEDITACLNCAMLAPSACNSQPWKFTVVTGEKAGEIAIATQGMGMNKFTSEVGVFIVVSEGSYNKTALVGSKIKDQDYKSVDIGLATSQLCLCATELGLSTCILGWFDEKKIKNLINTKSRIRLVIALGYSTKEEVATNKARKNFQDVVDFID
ncbi:MAG: nitroreductase family protein [Bacillota bacterium]